MYFFPLTLFLSRGADLPPPCYMVIGGYFQKNTSLAPKGALAHRLRRRTAAPPAKSKMAARGPQNGQQGQESYLILDFWVFLSTFAN